MCNKTYFKNINIKNLISIKNNILDLVKKANLS